MYNTLWITTALGLRRAVRKYIICVEKLFTIVAVEKLLMTLKSPVIVLWFYCHNIFRFVNHIYIFKIFFQPRCNHRTSQSTSQLTYGTQLIFVQTLKLPNSLFINVPCLSLLSHSSMLPSDCFEHDYFSNVMFTQVGVWRNVKR